MGKGRFIVFEGGDCAGKTTQVNRLSRRLRVAGIEHIVTRQPGGTKTGDVVRSLLLDTDQELDYRCEALLYSADKASILLRWFVPRSTAGWWCCVIATWIRCSPIKVLAEASPPTSWRPLPGGRLPICVRISPSCSTSTHRRQLRSKARRIGWNRPETNSTPGSVRAFWILPRAIRSATWC